MLIAMSLTDHELLEKFTQERCEDAFSELLRRHVNLVYSAALRQVRSPDAAEEVAQMVFADFARGASRLRPQTVLSAWLYQVTRRTAVDYLRRESRRQQRERVAVEMRMLGQADADDAWEQVEPLLEEVMEGLKERDRAALILRFFEHKTLREVGEALGTSEDAAQKVVDRALDRLRSRLCGRGITVGVPGLAAAICAHAVQAAPVSVTATVCGSGAVTGALLHSSRACELEKAFAVTKLAKATFGLALAGFLGTVIYQAIRSHGPRADVQPAQAEPEPDPDYPVASATVYLPVQARLPAATPAPTAPTVSADFAAKVLDATHANDIALRVQTLKTAAVDHYAKFGDFPLDSQFEATLIEEGFLEQRTDLVASSIWAHISPAAGPDELVTGANLAYSLDGGGTNNVTGRVVVEAVVSGITAEGAGALDELIDGRQLSGPMGEANLIGRVKYDAIPPNATGEVHIYVTHR